LSNIHFKKKRKKRLPHTQKKRVNISILKKVYFLPTSIHQVKKKKRKKTIR